jgi:hypothetical protein
MGSKSTQRLPQLQESEQFEHRVKSTTKEDFFGNHIITNTRKGLRHHGEHQPKKASPCFGTVRQLLGTQQGLGPQDPKPLVQNSKETRLGDR